MVGPLCAPPSQGQHGEWSPGPGRQTHLRPFATYNPRDLKQVTSTCPAVFLFSQWALVPLLKIRRDADVTVGTERAPRASALIKRGPHPLFQPWSLWTCRCAAARRKVSLAGDPWPLAVSSFPQAAVLRSLRSFRVTLLMWSTPW